MQVLVADSAPAARSALKLYIEQWRTDARILEAGSSAEVMEHAATTRIDVALVDWHLPKLGGQTTVLRLRSLQPSACIIVLSGRPEAVKEVREAEADAFISKADPPDTLRMLLERPDACPDEVGRKGGSAGVFPTRRRSRGVRQAFQPRLGTIPI